VAVTTPRFVAVLSLCGLLAACSSGPPVLVPPPAPAASASAAPSPLPAASELTLAFAGDTHFYDRTAGLLKNPSTAIGPFASQLQAADFAMVNLETAITDRGTPEPKDFHFRTTPAAYEALRAAGIDLASIANNHGMDYGRVGLTDTLTSAAAAGFPLVGAGNNIDEAYKPYFTTVKGVRIGVVAMNQVHDNKNEWKPTATRSGIAYAFDVERSVKAVVDARAGADLVIAYLHYGTQSATCPNPEQKSIALALSSAGADIIVGTHAHVLQGDGYLGKTYVHYGLGNFVWHSDFRGTDTGLLTMRVRPFATGAKVVERTFIPGVTSSSTGGVPKPATGDALKAVQGRIDAARRCTGLPQDPPA
jgi:poly-gamma-glutamate synthesis protein (capsule biosynthesis protein)